MRRIFFSCFICLLVAGAAVAPLAAHAQHKSHPYAALGEQILVLVNQHRTHMGLMPLAMNETIIAAAESHSRDMGIKKVAFGHSGFDARMNKLAKQLPPSHAFAENVAYGPTTAKEAVELWLHSPGHRKNIEGDYNITGVGIFEGKDGNLYYTQIFIKHGN